MEKYATMVFFGGALALFCWRFTQASRADLPAAVTRDEVPDMPVPLLVADPALVVGMSYQPGPLVDAPSYRANIPFTRPAMPPPPPAAV